jgi:hypothetical protein
MLSRLRRSARPTLPGQINLQRLNVALNQQSLLRGFATDNPQDPAKTTPAHSGKYIYKESSSGGSPNVLASLKDKLPKWMNNGADRFDINSGKFNEFNHRIPKD